jgi:hypothetical protein
MPNRFTSQAANADSMAEDAQANGATEGMSPAIGADGTPRDRSDRTQPQTQAPRAKADDAKAQAPQEGEAKPGKDINAAGFVKDKDDAKP